MNKRAAKGRGEILWVEDWHLRYTGDHVAIIDIRGHRFQLTARPIQGTSEWLWSVDYGFHHRSGGTTGDGAMHAAYEAALAWERSL